MKGHHPLKDLTPRDVISRVLHRFHKSGKRTYLDIRNIKNFTIRFPTVSHLCMQNKILLEDGFIPISPGAHFTMGGVDVDLLGRTTIQGLYAVGEVANTGVHGANRLE